MKLDEPQERAEWLHDFRSRLKARIESCNDLIRDAASWNRNHTESLFDCQPVKRTRDGLTKALEAVNNGERIPTDTFDLFDDADTFSEKGRPIK